MSSSDRIGEPFGRRLRIKLDFESLYDDDAIAAHRSASAAIRASCSLAQRANRRSRAARSERRS